MPHLQKIYEKYQNQGFSMVAINTVESQNEMLPEWRKQKNFTFPILVGAKRDWLVQSYQYRGAPTNLLVNEQDKILFRHLGYRTGGEKVMEGEIREMLGLEPLP